MRRILTVAEAETFLTAGVRTRFGLCRRRGTALRRSTDRSCFCPAAPARWRGELVGAGGAVAVAVHSIRSRRDLLSRKPGRIGSARSGPPTSNRSSRDFRCGRGTTDLVERHDVAAVRAGIWPSVSTSGRKCPAASLGRHHWRHHPTSAGATDVAPLLRRGFAGT
jgi:hypothetical protein